MSMSASGFAGGTFDVGAYETRGDRSDRGRRAGATPADRGLRRRPPRRRRRPAVRALRRAPPRRPRARPRRGDGALGRGAAGTARPRSLRHGARARRRVRRPPDRRASGPCAEPKRCCAALAHPARARRRRRRRASTTSSACDPTRSSCAGRTSAPTAPAAAPTSGRSSSSASSEPMASLTRIEQFDADRDAEALARFDELTAEPPRGAPRAPPRASRTPRPRTRPASTPRSPPETPTRSPTLFADDVEVVDHTTGATYDRQGALATWRSLLRARDPTYRHEPLATLGDSLALCRQSMSASGFAGRTFDVGAYESEQIVLIEVDAQGRRRRAEVFAADRLGDAVARLYERYAELLPDGPERTRAAATARSVAAMLGPFDLDRYATAFAPDVEFVDHRTVGFGSARGAEALLRSAPRPARARRRRRHPRRRRPRPAIRRAPRALDELRHRPRQRRRLRAAVPPALGLRSRRPRDAHRAVRRRPRRRGARPLRRADGRAARRRRAPVRAAACDRTPRPRTPPASTPRSLPETPTRSRPCSPTTSRSSTITTGATYDREGALASWRSLLRTPRPDVPARAAGDPRRLARAVPPVDVGERVRRRDVRRRRLRDESNRPDRGRRAGATPADRGLRRRPAGRRRRPAVRALRRAPPRRPRARPRRGDGALGRGDAGTVRPRSLRHGARARHRVRRPPDPRDLVRARGGSAAASTSAPCSSSPTTSPSASTTSSACGPTRSSCAGRTSAPTAPAAAPTSGRSSRSGSSEPMAS